MVNRFPSLAALLLTTTALAASVDGQGRVSVGGGWRLATPNGSFFTKAEAAGVPLTGPSIGGPQGAASFGYGAHDFFEVAIDLFIGADAFRLADHDFVSVTYGALLGGRLTKADFPFVGLTPWLGVQLGPSLAFVTSKTRPNPERLTTGYSVDLGALYRLTERFGVHLGVRYLFCFAEVDGIGAVNAGGLFFTLGVSILFPKSAQEQRAPGF